MKTHPSIVATGEVNEVERCRLVREALDRKFRTLAAQGAHLERAERRSPPRVKAKARLHLGALAATRTVGARG